MKINMTLTSICAGILLSACTLAPEITPDKPNIDLKPGNNPDEGDKTEIVRDQEKVVWAEINGVNCPIPPIEHPRLYIRKGEIETLKAKIASPDGQAIIKKIQAAAAIPEDPDAESQGFRYYQNLYGDISAAELQALDYLTKKDAAQARKAIETMLKMLQTTNFGTKNDMSRASGIRIMVASIVYDWCYDQMTSQERLAYIKEFKRIAGTMECHYPPKKNEPIVGHSSEWMILRDLLSAGVATYDEDQEIYNHVISMLCELYFPVRNYTYAGHNYHQGTGYVTVRFLNDLNSLFILDRMGAKNIYSPDMQYVMYPLIYRRRPDGQVLPLGDVNPQPRTKASGAQNPQNYSMIAMLAGSYFNDPYIMYEYDRTKKVETHMLILELLWRNFDLKGTAPNDLPLTYYSGTPFGSMIARTGWDENTAMAEMKINEHYFANHMHLDAGSFQFYYRGPLAIDSGSYQGASGGYNSPHNKNYFKRTIAHNSLLVYDPDEKFACWNYGGDDKTEYAANDGGQRMPGDRWDAVRSFEQLTGPDYTIGQVLAHEYGPDAMAPDYSYLKGDITKAYSKKVKDVRRSYVFFNLGTTTAKASKRKTKAISAETIPAAMVIYDHIESANPDFKKYWLLHSIEEPQIKGSTFSVSRTKDGDTGKLTADVLLPESHNIETVGGQGKEFWVFGENYPNAATTRPDPCNERGEWRVEVTPAKAAAEDCFLTVLQVSDNSVSKLHTPAIIKGTGVTGASVADRAVIFCKDSKTIASSAEFELASANFTGSEKLNVLVTDLEPGTWQVVKGGKVLYEDSVKADEGTLYFTATATGTYTLARR